MHQRYQPKEVPVKKMGFQVGPYRIDKSNKGPDRASRKNH